MKNFARFAVGCSLSLGAGAALADSVGGPSYPYPYYPSPYYTPPPVVSPVPNILCPGAAPLINGQCVDAAGFSGAALASQALSSLSQSTTQTTSDKAMGKVEERREQEANPRQADQSQPSARPASTFGQPLQRQTAAPAPREARRGPTVEVRPEGHAGAAAPSRTVPVERTTASSRKTAGGRRERLPLAMQPAGGPPAVTPAEMDGLPRPAYPLRTLFGTPVPISPDSKFGVWTQGYGDYEQRTANSGGYTIGGAGIPNPIIPTRIDARSRTTSYGLQFGADVTSRNVFSPGDGLITGVMIGWSNADLSLQTRTTSSNLLLLDNGSSQLNAAYTGGLAGVYATYFNGAFSADFLFKADAYDLGVNFSDYIAFAPNSLGPGGQPIYAPAARIFPYWSSSHLPVFDFNLVGNLNYRIHLAPRWWVEPTVGAMYTATLYDWRASRVGLADGEQVRLQGGARFGVETILGATPTTLTLTGLAYNDVLIAGGFVGSLAFNGQNLLQQANQNQMRGRGIIALNFDHGGGLSSFIQGEGRGGYGLVGGGGKIGVRYAW